MARGSFCARSRRHPNTTTISEVTPCMHTSAPGWEWVLRRLAHECRTWGTSNRTMDTEGGALIWANSHAKRYRCAHAPACSTIVRLPLLQPARTHIPRPQECLDLCLGFRAHATPSPGHRSSGGKQEGVTCARDTPRRCSRGCRWGAVPSATAQQSVRSPSLPQLRSQPEAPPTRHTKRKRTSNTQHMFHDAALLAIIFEDASVVPIPSATCNRWPPCRSSWRSMRRPPPTA